MRHVRNANLFQPQLLFDFLLLFFRLVDLLAQGFALFDQAWSIGSGRLWNLRRDFLLLTTQFIAFGNQRVSLISQTNHGIDVYRHSAFEAIVDDLVTMFADELQVQHWGNS